MIDLYEVLQVDRTAEPEVLRGAYRALARKYHPDFGGSARLMASINDAWAVLGDPERRAAYDVEPQSSAGRPAPASSPIHAPDPPPAEPQVHAAGSGLPGRRPAPHTDGTVLDFGRYAGWTIGRLADQDPDYLEWLARTTIGRHLVGEIDRALARRAAEAATHPAGLPPARRRAFL